MLEYKGQGCRVQQGGFANPGLFAVLALGELKAVGQALHEHSRNLVKFSLVLDGLQKLLVAVHNRLEQDQLAVVVVVALRAVVSGNQRDVTLLAELKGVDDLKFMLISLIVDQRNQFRPVFLVFQISHKQCTPFRVCRVLFTVT